MQLILIGFRFLLKAMYILLTEAQKMSKRINNLGQFYIPNWASGPYQFSGFLDGGVNTCILKKPTTTQPFHCYQQLN